jgi:hypothetical protein
VGFSADGNHLIVTTKASGSDLDVFAVDRDGRLSAVPKVTASTTPVPSGNSWWPRPGTAR